MLKKEVTPTIEDRSEVMEVTEESCTAIVPSLTGATGSDTGTVTIRESGMLLSNGSNLSSILIKPESSSNGTCFGDDERFLFILECLAGNPSCFRMFCIHDA